MNKQNFLVISILLLLSIHQPSYSMDFVAPFMSFLAYISETLSEKDQKKPLNLIDATQTPLSTVYKEIEQQKNLKDWSAIYDLLKTVNDAQENHNISAQEIANYALTQKDPENRNNFIHVTMGHIDRYQQMLKSQQRSIPPIYLIIAVTQENKVVKQPNNNVLHELIKLGRNINYLNAHKEQWHDATQLSRITFPIPIISDKKTTTIT